jgi:hypothetical protein
LPHGVDGVPGDDRVDAVLLQSGGQCVGAIGVEVNDQQQKPRLDRRQRLRLP